jgi:DNA invertase Pin-like site-specific DNA recombinase
MISKIQPYHLEKPAYVYIRQSTMGQVRHHQESTERQYALKNRAQELGWPAARVRVLDGDLGMSGAQSASREDFKTLVADVSMNKVGAVLALEASRLARSCTDWHRLLELCALTHTLILDEDGCYDPDDFNDLILLGFKGTMSQAELHFIRARLQGGKLNKARKGELRFPLPVGLCYDEAGRTILDPDAEVRGALRQVFASFRETGSAYGVTQKFGTVGFQFPKRSYGGVWNGKLVWGRLTYDRVLAVLRNPAYAGTYVFGRYHGGKKILPDGQIRSTSSRLPMDEWAVTIKGHHEGYISWEEFLENQKLLEENRVCTEETVLSGPAREGLALLQGLLLCGVCGRRITIRYQGFGGIYPVYQCNWRKREGLTKNSCISVACDIMDRAVSDRILEVLTPDQIEIALAALSEIEIRSNATDNQWRMRLERTKYEAELAQRRYEEVDPANRLVASTLEHRWNEALVRLEQLEGEYAAYQKEKTPVITPEQKANIRLLAKDLPRLWNAPEVGGKDRKRILRLLIKDITVEKCAEPKKLILHLRWQGGAGEDIPVVLPPNMCDRLRYPQDIVEKVRRLAVRFTDNQIAETLNREGLSSAKGKPFTKSMVQWICYKHAIPPVQLKRPGEMTVAETARHFGVSLGVVYYWIGQEIITARQIDNKPPYWININPQKEKELHNLVRNSKRIHPKHLL